MLCGKGVTVLSEVGGVPFRFEGAGEGFECVGELWNC